MNLYTGVDGNSVKITPKLNLGQWNMIYAVYVYTVGGRGTSLITVNGVLAPEVAVTFGAYGPSYFSNADRIYVGSGLTGHIKRFQVYSPGVIRLNQGNTEENFCSQIKRRL